MKDITIGLTIKQLTASQNGKLISSEKPLKFNSVLLSTSLANLHVLFFLFFFRNSWFLVWPW